MKSKRSFLALTLIAALGALGVAACSSSATSSNTSSGAASTSGKTKTIDFVFHVPPADPCCGAVFRGLKDAAAKYGVNVRLLTPQTFDVPEYAALIDQARVTKPDGIIVSDAYPPNQAQIARLTAAGIPVILVNSGYDNLQKDGAMAYVGQDEVLSGTRAGEEMAKEGVKVALCLIHTPGLTVLEQRCQGFSNAMNAAGGKAIVLNFQGGNPTTATSAIQGALKANPSVTGVLALGAEGFNGAIPAIKNLGLKHIKIASYDANVPQLEKLQSGAIDFIVDQQLYLEGYLPVQEMALYLQTGMRPIGYVLTGPRILLPADVTPLMMANAKNNIS